MYAIRIIKRLIMAKDFLYCEQTDTKVYSGDIVTISPFSDVRFIAKKGWYKLGSAQKNGWYFVNISDRSIIPVDNIDIKDIVNLSRQSSEVSPRPEISNSPTVPNNKDYLEIPNTDLHIYPNDLVNCLDFPGKSFVMKYGWYSIDDAQVKGWYLLNLEDRSIISIDAIDISHITKNTLVISSEYKPTLKDIDAAPAVNDFIIIPGTNIRLYDSDIVKISDKPRIKWVVHTGWYIYGGNQNFGWYFVSIKDGTILPASIIDLTLCTLVTTKTQGSEKYDGKVVNYTRPFTVADAELLNRTFITVETIEQRDNLDKKKLVNGKLVRCNDVGGAPNYYAWNDETKEWNKVDFGNGGGIPEVIGTTEHPIILSNLEPGLYRVIGTYKISPTYEMITLTGIHHIAFVSEDDEPNIKVITDTDITDYIVTGDDVTFVNIYATQQYVTDNYATKIYVDNKIAVIEAQISELIAGLDDRILNIVNDRLDDALNNITETYIDSLFD